MSRRHADGLWDLEDDEHAHVARAASRVTRLLRIALAPGRVNLVHASGTAAWRSVSHLHVHVVPRYRPDELQLMWEAARRPLGSWPRYDNGQVDVAAAPAGGPAARRQRG